MRILVFLRQILDPRGIVVNRRAGKVFINREEYISNPADRGALELALRIQDAAQQLNGRGPAVEIVAVALGPERVETVLRDALALQVHRALRLADPGFEQADAAVTARLLQSLAEFLGSYDLFVLGEDTLDTADCQTGPRLSALLDRPLVSGVIAAVWNGETLEIQRRLAGVAERVEVQLPAVLTVQSWAVKPRYPHGGKIIEAYRQGRVEVLSAADLNLDSTALEPATERRGPEFPPERELGTLVTGSPEYIAEQVGMVLKRYRR